MGGDTLSPPISIDMISDLHGYKPSTTGGDLLIVAGDLTGRDSFREYIDFLVWLKDQEYTSKIVIAGNHDVLLQGWGLPHDLFPKNTHYLCDSGFDFNGLKIWGSPWTAKFPNQNPCAMAFAVHGEALYDKWELIPEGTDILVTHSPPRGYFDTCHNGRVGCPHLRDRVSKIKPRVHCFGHIHEGGGQQVTEGATTYVNGAHVDWRYQPKNSPIRVTL